MKAAQQGVRKRREGFVVTRCYGWPEGKGVASETYASGGYISAAEIAGHAKPMIKVSGQGGIPAVQITAVLPAELVSAENFCFWGNPGPLPMKPEGTESSQLTTYTCVLLLVEVWSAVVPAMRLRRPGKQPYLACRTIPTCEGKRGK